MDENIRRNLLLSQLNKVGEVTGLNKEENDTLGDLPTQEKFSKDSRTKSKLMGEENISQWDEYFDYNGQIELDGTGFNFNYYYTLPLATDVPSIPIFIFHHGAGSSGLSFANVSREICSQLKGKTGCFAFDARGHGNTTFQDSVKLPTFTRDEYVSDYVAFINYILSRHLNSIPREKLTLILVGHSLGGSICTFTYKILPQEIRRSVQGVAMFDIVEEAAIQALEKVQHFLYTTPNVFDSYNDAIEWHINHGLSKYKESAKIAIPALFRKTSNGKVVRITDLKMFRPYWNTWFVDLSHTFVDIPTTKLLILAGNDNLDKELIIGQMQGKYQLVVFQDSNHFIQEDCPKKSAITLIDFWKRNDNKNVVIKSNWGSSLEK